MEEDAVAMPSLGHYTRLGPLFTHLEALAPHHLGVFVEVHGMMESVTGVGQSLAV